MAKIQNAFNTLKKTITGDKNDAIDKKIDKSIKDIEAFKTQSGRAGYIDLVKTVVSKATSSMDSGMGGLTQQQTNPAMMGQANRMARYNTYESIISMINYAHRALSVLTDNILSPDDITKICLEVQAIKELKDEVESSAKIGTVKEVIKNIKIEDHLNLLVFNTLKFGDYFCEIADAKNALSSAAYLAESEERKQFITEINHTVEKTKDHDEMSIKINMDFSLLESTDPPKSKNISLVFHEPSQVIKLQSEMFPICFGYIVFPKAATNPQSAMNDQVVNDLCSKILNSLSNKIPNMEEFQKDDDLKDIVRSLVKSNDPTKIMQIRFIPSDRMQHFQKPSTKYFPYGESVIDNCQFTAKLLIALETALAVHRLARSTEKRKIAVEVGLPRDAKKMVEEIKSQFRKRKVTLDEFGSVDAIPSMISTFEDIYIPQKDGKAFVDVSTFSEGNVDIRGKVDELKFLRDEIVASLGVPASFLNIEENLSNKNTLTEENILFARTIVNHQKYLTSQIQNLLGKVFSIINPEDALTMLENINVNFPTPKSLQYEREARYLSELANMIETLERIGIPKEYSRRKYITSIDWKEMEQYETHGKIDASMGTGDEEDEGGFGGGGGF